MLQNTLLDKARAAGGELARAEERCEGARTEYHALVRRMHLAGGSLREIAEALGMSHQRVQQIVDGAGGSWWKKVWRSRRPGRAQQCSFCGRTPEQVERLIAGPNVFICGECVARAAVSGRAGRCSFCRKRAAAERLLAMEGKARICSECIATCRQILIDCEP